MHSFGLRQCQQLQRWHDQYGATKPPGCAAPGGVSGSRAPTWPPGGTRGGERAGVRGAPRAAGIRPPTTARSGGTGGSAAPSSSLSAPGPGGLGARRGGEVAPGNQAGRRLSPPGPRSLPPPRGTAGLRISMRMGPAAAGQSTERGGAGAGSSLPSATLKGVFRTSGDKRVFSCFRETPEILRIAAFNPLHSHGRSVSPPCAEGLRSIPHRRADKAPGPGPHRSGKNHNNNLRKKKRK